MGGTPTNGRRGDENIILTISAVAASRMTDAFNSINSRIMMEATGCSVRVPRDNRLFEGLQQIRPDIKSRSADAMNSFTWSHWKLSVKVTGRCRLNPALSDQRMHGLRDRVVRPIAVAFSCSRSVNPLRTSDGLFFGLR
jgi:hypothetical protein